MAFVHYSREVKKTSHLVSAFSSMRHLTCLELIETKVDVKTLATGLSLINLQKFILLSKDDEDAKEILSLLQDKSTLRHLEISFRADTSSSGLVSLLPRKELEVFRLSHFQFGANSIQQLCDLISEATKLRRITLDRSNFASCGGLKEMIEEVGHHPSLAGISLQYAHLPKEFEDTFHSLLEQFPYLKCELRLVRFQ